MSSNRGNKRILQKLLKEISVVLEITNECTKEAFLSDDIKKRATAMTIINIGELSSVLTDDFKEENQHIPWRKIKGLRNIIAHRYEIVDFEDLWETSITNIPELSHEIEKLLLCD